MLEQFDIRGCNLMVKIILLKFAYCSRYTLSLCSHCLKVDEWPDSGPTSTIKHLLFTHQIKTARLNFVILNPSTDLSRKYRTGRHPTDSSKPQ
jgi:hypothetical protein